MNIGFILIPIGLLFLYIGYRLSGKSGELNTFVPVNAINQAPSGMPVMLHGSIQAAQPLIAPLTHQPCVYFEFVHERASEQTDATGQTQTIWQQVESGQRQSLAFQLTDPTGQIMVDPTGAEIQNIRPTTNYIQPSTLGTLLHNHGGQVGAVIGQLMTSPTQTTERVVEQILPVNIETNIFGMVREEGSLQSLTATDDVPLIITDKTKDLLVKSEKSKSTALYVVSALIFLAAAYFLAKQYLG